MHYLEKELFDEIKTGSKIIHFIERSVLDGVWIWDLNNKENNQDNFFLLEYLGYDLTEINHNTIDWSSIIHADDLLKISADLEQNSKNPNFIFNHLVRYFHKNGDSIWFRVKGKFIVDKMNVPSHLFAAHTLVNAHTLDILPSAKLDSKIKEQFSGLMVQESRDKESVDSFILDLKNRINLNKEIEFKENQLQLLVDKSSDSLLVFNDKLQLIFSSKQFENIIGWKIDNYPMDIVETMGFVHPDDQERIWSEYNEARIKKLTNYRSQHRSNNIHNKEIWVEDHLTFEYDESGNFKRVYIITRDITNRKKIEFELLQEIEKRQEIANKVSIQKENGKEELYTTLKNDVEVFLEQSKKDLIESEHSNNKYIQAALNHINEAINEIKKIALESSSQFILNDYFVEGLTTYFESFNRLSPVRFIVENRIDTSICLIENCKHHLFRICQELAQNAIKHSTATELKFRFKFEKNEIILIAKDNGDGFKDKKINLGIGIKSILDRVLLIGGEVRFFYFNSSGLAVYLKFKL